MTLAVALAMIKRMDDKPADAGGLGDDKPPGEGGVGGTPAGANPGVMKEVITYFSPHRQPKEMTTPLPPTQEVHII